MKIKDKFLLGVVSGFIGNIPKVILEKTFIKLGLAEISGTDRAAGIFVPPHKLADPKGKAIGWLSDSGIASMLGVAFVYGLAVTGNNQAAIKGAMAGQATWTVLYGVLGSLGATKVKPLSPKTFLSEFLSHTVYGATTAFVANKLADPDLFSGKVPLIATPIAQSVRSKPQQQAQLDNSNNKYDLEQEPVQLH